MRKSPILAAMLFATAAHAVPPPKATPVAAVPPALAVQAPEEQPQSAPAPAPSGIWLPRNLFGLLDNYLTVVPPTGIPGGQVKQLLNAWDTCKNEQTPNAGGVLISHGMCRAPDDPRIAAAEKSATSAADERDAAAKRADSAKADADKLKALVADLRQKIKTQESELESLRHLSIIKAPANCTRPGEQP